MSVKADILDAIQVQLEAFRSSDNYPLAIKRISRFDENLTATEKDKVPMLMMIDPNEWLVEVRDETDYRLAGEIIFRGYIEGSSEGNCLTELGKIEAFLYQFIDAAPSMHTAVREFGLTGTESARYDQDEKAADVIVKAKLSYVAAIGTF